MLCCVWARCSAAHGLLLSWAWPCCCTACDPVAVLCKWPWYYAACGPLQVTVCLVLPVDFIVLMQQKEREITHETLLNYFGTPDFLRNLKIIYVFFNSFRCIITPWNNILGVIRCTENSAGCFDHLQWYQFGPQITTIFWPLPVKKWLTYLNKFIFFLILECTIFKTWFVIFDGQNRNPNQMVCLEFKVALSQFADVKFIFWPQGCQSIFLR